MRFKATWFSFTRRRKSRPKRRLPDVLSAWGLVVAGSVKRDGVNVNFQVTDTAQTVSVRYAGILPDLFKEGKGVVAQGQLRNGLFEAKEVLAKHDENYMPPEAAEALKNAAKSNEKTATSVVTGK